MTGHDQVSESQCCILGMNRADGTTGLGCQSTEVVSRSVSPEHCQGRWTTHTETNTVSVYMEPGIQHVIIVQCNAAVQFTRTWQFPAPGVCKAKARFNDDVNFTQQTDAVRGPEICLQSTLTFESLAQLLTKMVYAVRVTEM